MDPLSVMASVVGLLTAAGTVTSILLSLKSSLSDAPRLIDHVILEVREVEISLSAMHKFLIGISSVPKRRIALIQVDQLRATLTDSVLTFSELEALVTPLIGRSDILVLERVKWAWKEDAVSRIMQRLQRHKSSLSLMLNIVQCESDLEAEKSRQSLQNLVEQLVQSNEEISRRLCNLEETYESQSTLTRCFRNVSNDQLAADDGGETATITPNRLPSKYPDNKRINPDVTLFQFTFENELNASRVYQRTCLYKSDVSFTSSAVRTHSWSIFSGLSLGQVSIVSAIALPLYSHDISNSQWYNFGNSNQVESHPPVFVGKTPSEPNMLNKGVSQESDVQNVAATAAYAGGVSNGATWHPKYKWWDEGRIEGTVNRQFVLSHLLPHGIQQLDQHLSFGDGLTDDTYMDWINQRAKIIFLILVDLGVPDQIFGVIDDSWDDNDLPIPLDQVSRLRLTHEKDPKFERRFYQRQFTYLLRYIQFGDSLFYTDDEAVPLVVADKHPIVGLRNNNIDKVYPVNNPENILLRQKILLGQGSGEMRQEEFLAGIEEQKPIKHKHIVTIWASYIHQDGGYILLTPINEGTLKSFLKVMPPAIKVMAKRDRRVLFLNWLHCLASALAFLHRQGFSHHKIKPSNVMMDGDGKIFLNNSDLLSPHQATDTKRYFDKESYDYAAPEKWSERPIATPKRSDMLFVHPQTCNAPPPGMRRISMFPDQPAIISSTSLSSFKTETMYTTPSQSPRPDPQKSDIFSLGCVFLDIVTVFMKRRPFSSLRSALGKTAGVGGGPPDSSYHKNLEQVYIWIGILAKDASKNEDKIFRSVSHILQLVTRMLSLNPSNRPGAQFVRSRLEDILTKVGGIEDVCCSAKTDHIKPSPWSLSSGIASPGIPNIEGQVPQYHQRSRSYVTTENEHSSINTRRSSWDGGNRNEAQPGEGKTSMNTGMAIGTVKPKPRAWQVPVYAEISFG